MKYQASKLFGGRKFYYSYFNNSAGPGEVHSHDFYEIFLTTKGDFLHIINGVEYTLSQGSLVLIRPYDIHSNRFLNKPQSCVQVCFTANTADALFSYLDNDFLMQNLIQSELPPTIELSAHDFKILLQAFRKSETIDYNNQTELNKYYKKLLFTIFTSYFCKYLSMVDNNIPSWLVKVLNVTQENLLYIDGVDKIVEASGKSYKTISRNLKRYYGKTPSEYVLDLRLTYAYNLILTTNLSITDICYDCGFNNTSYFFKSFKKKYSETPNEVRSTSKVL